MSSEIKRVLNLVRENNKETTGIRLPNKELTEKHLQQLALAMVDNSYVFLLGFYFIPPDELNPYIELINNCIKRNQQAIIEHFNHFKINLITLIIKYRDFIGKISHPAIPLVIKLFLGVVFLVLSPLVLSIMFLIAYSLSLVNRINYKKKLANINEAIQNNLSNLPPSFELGEYFLLKDDRHKAFEAFLNTPESDENYIGAMANAGSEAWFNREEKTIAKECFQKGLDAAREQSNNEYIELFTFQLKLIKAQPDEIIQIWKKAAPTTHYSQLRHNFLSEHRYNFLNEQGNDSDVVAVSDEPPKFLEDEEQLMINPNSV